MSARSELGVLLLSLLTVTGLPLAKSLSPAVKSFEEEEAYTRAKRGNILNSVARQQTTREFAA